MSRFSVFLAIALIFAGNASKASQTAVAPQNAELEAWADSLFKPAEAAHRFSGLEIVVVKDGAIALSKAYGYADPGTGRSIDPSTTTLRIGSTSKTITATAVAQLYGRGKIHSLDDPANRYLKRIRLPSWHGNPITVWDLLTHRAGFEDHAFGLGTDKFIARPADKKTVRRGMPEQVRAPGGKSVYSNYSVALLGILVEDVSGEPLQTYFADHIFKPLGMNHSRLNYALKAPPNMAVPYAYFPDGEKERSIYTPINPFIAPAGGVNTTGLDMARFMEAHIAGQNGQDSILRASTFRLMHARHVANDPAVTGFGMVFIEGEWNGVHVIEHGGGWPGFQTVMLMVPEKRLGVFVSIIGDPPMPGLGEEFASLVTHTRLAPNQSVRVEPLLNSAYVREAALTHFLGAYRPPHAAVADPSLARFVGTYCRLRRSETTLEAVFDLFGANFAVWQVAEGAAHTLTIREVPDYRQVAPGVFWNSNGTVRSMGDPNASELYAFGPAKGRAAYAAPLLSVDVWERCNGFWNPASIFTMLPVLLLLFLTGAWCLFWRASNIYARAAKCLPLLQFALLLAIPLVLFADYGPADGLMYRLLMAQPGRFVALALVGNLSALVACGVAAAAVASWFFHWWGEGAWGAAHRIWYSAIAIGSMLLLAILFSLNLVGWHLP